MKLKFAKLRLEFFFPTRTNKTFSWYCKIWYFVVNSNVRKNLFSFVYMFTSPSKRNEYQVKHILGRMIKSRFWSWLAPPRHQLVKFHHVTWSHQAAMILRTSTHLFCKGLNIKGLMSLKGLSIFEIYSDWTQACLIYIVRSTLVRSSTLLFQYCIIFLDT